MRSKNSLLRADNSAGTESGTEITKNEVGDKDIFFKKNLKASGRTNREDFAAE